MNSISLIERKDTMDDKYVSLATFESAMMHLQQANKRLSIITVTALVLMCMVFSMFIYLLYNFDMTAEKVSLKSDKGNANYIGNDGDIVNDRSESEETDN